MLFHSNDLLGPPRGTAKLVTTLLPRIAKRFRACVVALRNVDHSFVAGAAKKEKDFQDDTRLHCHTSL